MADYTTTFPQPLKTAIYDVSIDDDEKSPVCERKEVIHKAQRSDYTTFKAAERKAEKFILSVV